MWVRLKRRGVCLELLVRDDAVLPPPPASAAGGGRTPPPSPLLSDSIYTNGAAGRRAGAADLAAAFGAPTPHATAVAVILSDGVPRRPAAAAAAAAAARTAAVLNVLLTQYVHATTGEPLWANGNRVAGRALTRQWKEEATASLAAAAAAAGLPVGESPGDSAAAAAARLASALAHRGGPRLTPGPLVADVCWHITSAPAAVTEPARTAGRPPPPLLRTPFWASCPALTVTQLNPTERRSPHAADAGATAVTDHRFAEPHDHYRVTLRPVDWEALLDWAWARGGCSVRALPPEAAWPNHPPRDGGRRAAAAATDRTLGGGPHVRSGSRGRGGGGRDATDRGRRRAARARDVARRAACAERRWSVALV